MNEATKRVIEAFQSEVMTLIRLIFEDNGISNNKKINKNTLADSKLKERVQVEIRQKENPVIIEALFNHYITFLEWNRPKKHGKRPPIDALRGWASARGISTDNSTLWAISTAIWRDGHEGRPIIATLEKEIENSYNKEYSNKLFDAIIDELIKYFN